MEMVKPIPAFYRNGKFEPNAKLNLPENTKVYLILVAPFDETELEIASEQAAAEDYFQFEKENDCVPSDAELKYYYRIASHESR